MKNVLVLLVSALLATGCVVNTDDESDYEYNSPITEEEGSGLGGWSDKDNGPGDSCYSSYESFELPDGTTTIIEIPGLCNQFNVYMGDPFNPNMRTDGIDQQSNPEEVIINELFGSN